LNNYFNLLGFVPYKHVVSLLFHSNILINPSLFEGWSTTVEEGKILDKKMILSNLNVHKEQAPMKATFFNPNNAEDLAKKIIKLHNIKDNNLKISTLKKKYKKDRTYFANQFLTIVENSL
jgi:glycosyltransferase involved in cell wall biosynthesis